LIEVLVVMALLSLIIIGLVAMFSQTQRAYRLGTTQVDVLEGGRAVTDMMTRDFSQMSPAYQTSYGAWGPINCDITLQLVAPLIQSLAGSPGPGRTNLKMDVFFLTEENQRRSGIGYRVWDPATGTWPNGGVGSLYRYVTNGYYGQHPSQLFAGYATARHTDEVHVTRLLDGVVHFTVRAFDTNGVWINRPIGSTITNAYDLGFLRDEPYFSTFFSNAVPASVEIELGILEERALERARSIGNANTRSNFLAQQAGKVHLFRWRVPVRNVDPTAYQ
jgi:hypothetical protein